MVIEMLYSDLDIPGTDPAGTANTGFWNNRLRGSAEHHGCRSDRLSKVSPA
jgi:hypothetical protein